MSISVSVNSVLLNNVLVHSIPPSGTGDHYILGHVTVTNATANTFPRGSTDGYVFTGAETNPLINFELRPFKDVGTVTDPSIFTHNEPSYVSTDFDDVDGTTEDLFILTAVAGGETRVLPHFQGADKTNPINWAPKFHFRDLKILDAITITASGSDYQSPSFTTLATISDGFDTNSLSYYVAVSGKYYWIKSHAAASNLITLMPVDVARSVFPVLPALSVDVWSARVVSTTNPFSFNTSVDSLEFTVSVPAASGTNFNFPGIPGLSSGDTIYYYPAFDTIAKLNITTQHEVTGSVQYTASVHIDGIGNPVDLIPESLDPITNRVFNLRWNQNNLPAENASYQNVTLVVNDNIGHFLNFTFNIVRFETNPAPTFVAKTSSNNGSNFIYPVTPVNTQGKWWLMQNSGVGSPYVVATISKTGGDSSVNTNVTFSPSIGVLSTQNPSTTSLEIKYDRTALSLATISSVIYTEHGVSWFVSAAPSSVLSYVSISAGATSPVVLSTKWVHTNGTEYYRDGSRYEILSSTPPSDANLALVSSGPTPPSRYNWKISTQAISDSTHTLNLPTASFSGELLISFPTNSSNNLLQYVDLTPPVLQVYSSGTIEATDKETNDSNTFAIADLSIIPPMRLKSTFGFPDTALTPVNRNSNIDSDQVRWIFCEVSGAIPDNFEVVNAKDLIQNETGKYLDEGLRAVLTRPSTATTTQDFLEIIPTANSFANESAVSIASLTGVISPEDLKLVFRTSSSPKTLTPENANQLSGIYTIDFYDDLFDAHATAPLGKLTVRVGIVFWSPISISFDNFTKTYNGEINSTKNFDITVTGYTGRGNSVVGNIKNLPSQSTANTLLGLPLVSLSLAQSGGTSQLALRDFPFGTTITQSQSIGTQFTRTEGSQTATYTLTATVQAQSVQLSGTSTFVLKSGFSVSPSTGPVTYAVAGGIFLTNRSAIVVNKLNDLAGLVDGGGVPMYEDWVLSGTDADYKIADLSTYGSGINRVYKGQNAAIFIQKLSPTDSPLTVLNQYTNPPLPSTSTDLLLSTKAQSASSFSSPTSSWANVALDTDTEYKILIPTGNTVDMPEFPLYLLGYRCTFPDDMDHHVLLAHRILQWTQDLNLKDVTLERDNAFSFIDSISLRATPTVEDTSTTITLTDPDKYRSLVVKWKLERSLNNGVNWEPAIDSSGLALNFLDGDLANHSGHNIHSVNAMLQCLSERTSDDIPYYDVTNTFYRYRIQMVRATMFRDPNVRDPALAPLANAFSTNIYKKIHFGNDMKRVQGDCVLQKFLNYDLLIPGGAAQLASYNWTSDRRIAMQSFDGKSEASMQRVYSFGSNISRKVFRVTRQTSSTILDITDGMYPSPDVYFVNVPTETTLNVTLGPNMGSLQFMNTLNSINVLVPHSRYFYDPASDTSFSGLQISSVTGCSRQGDVTLYPLNSSYETYFSGNFLSPNPLVPSLAKFTCDGKFEFFHHVLESRKRINTPFSISISGVNTIEFTDASVTTSDYFKGCTVDFGSGVVRNVVSSTVPSTGTSRLVLDFPVPGSLTTFNMFYCNWQVNVY